MSYWGGTFLQTSLAPFIHEIKTCWSTLLCRNNISCLYLCLFLKVFLDLPQSTWEICLCPLSGTQVGWSVFGFCFQIIEEGERGPQLWTAPSTGRLTQNSLHFFGILTLQERLHCVVFYCFFSLCFISEVSWFAEPKTEPTLAAGMQRYFLSEMTAEAGVVLGSQAGAKDYVLCLMTSSQAIYFEAHAAALMSKVPLSSWSRAALFFILHEGSSAETHNICWILLVICVWELLDRWMDW